MAFKLVIFASALVAVSAAPQLWYTENYVPQLVYREARAPSIAYGFGSGLSTNIGGISHSSGIGASFNTGDGEAYGAGIAGSDGNVFANGIGYANTGSAPAPQRLAPAPQRLSPPPQQLAPYPLRYSYTYNYPQRNNYITANNNYPGYGTALAQTHNGPYSTSASAVQNGRYNAALTNSQSLRGYNQGGAVAAANSGYGASAASSSNGYGGTAISSAQSRDANGGLNLAVSAAENSGDYRASTAHTVQQLGNGVQQSGATSIDGPGIQASHAHSINTGYY